MPENVQFLKFNDNMHIWTRCDLENKYEESDKDSKNVSKEADASQKSGQNILSIVFKCEQIYRFKTMVSQWHEIVAR